MGIGHKIKEYRTKAGLTQKELADGLHITYQAVSRWENDDAEPSFDTLKDICEILNCSLDELFEMKKQNDVEEKPEEKVQIVEHVVVQEKSPVLGICEECNKPIYDSDDLNRVDELIKVKNGRATHTETRQKILCGECQKKREEKIKLEKEKKHQEFLEKLKKKRIHSFVWSTIVAILFLITGFSALAKGNRSNGIEYIITSVMVFCFIATMILNNTFLPKLWCEIASWGFVKMPGIIFDFSLDGIVSLIVIKIILFILSIILAILAVILATIVALFLGVFVYPFAISKNIKGNEKEED